MGCATSTSAVVTPTTWRIDCDYEDAIAKYENEGVISKKSPESEVELRVLLDDSVGLRFIMRALGDKAELMRCWAEIKEYSTSVSFRRERLNQICHKYSSLPYLMPPPGEGPNEFEAGKTTLANIGSLSSGEIPAVMQAIQLDVTRCCFRHLHELVFEPMKSTIEYDNMYARLGLLASQIKAEDFDYISTIAEGGFGLVLLGRKKSTGVHYAMKVQPKAVLLKHFRRNPHRVVAEMQAFAVCRHPYVSSLAYAFQTQTLAVMVMPVSSCGDLRRSASLCPNGRMPFARVQFYAAEIVSALCYLHSHGILYRDLKPANVLLHASGHIMLADFGSLADTGHVLDSSFKAHVTSCKSSSLNNSSEHTTQTGTGHSGIIGAGNGNNNNNNNNHSVQRKYSETSISMMQAGQMNFPPTQFTLGGGGGGRHRQGSLGGGSLNPGQMGLFGGDFDPDRKSGVYASDGVFSGLMMRGSGGVGLCELVGKPQDGESDPASKQREVGKDGSSSVNIAAAHLSSQGLSSHNSNRSSNSSGVVTRCASLVGTLAYMAPEVLIMFGKKRLNKDGYTDAVDWWSLGITLFRLLTGVDPFRPISYDRLRSIFPGVLAKHSNYYSAFVSVFGKINFHLPPSSAASSQPQRPGAVAAAGDGNEADASEVQETPPVVKNQQLDPTAIEIITQLLEFDAEMRLGTRGSAAVKAAAEKEESVFDDKDTISAKLDMEAGHKAVRNHAFFNGIDWNAIESASMPPPYIPASETLEVLQEGSLAQIRKTHVAPSSSKDGNSTTSVLFGKSSSTGPKVSPPTLFDMVRLSGKFMWVDNDALTVVPPPGSNVNSGKSMSSVRRSISMGALPEGNASNNNSVSNLGPSLSITGGGGGGVTGGSTKATKNWTKRFWLMTGQHVNGNMDEASNNLSTSMSAAVAGAGAGAGGPKQNPTKPGLKFALSEAQQEYFRDWQYASPLLVDS